MQSLIEAVRKLKNILPNPAEEDHDFRWGYNVALKDVIALIKQHSASGVDDKTMNDLADQIIIACLTGVSKGDLKKDLIKWLRPYLKQQQPVSASVVEAARKLLVQYDAYQNSAGNHEEAYYKLAKYAYPHWQELKAAMQGETQDKANLTVRE